ncbi:MAG: hypothetical protein J0L84_02370 [Verrucomicrobia bacterium]|nr:hypothetical protein [Verrucomicrobiota bacterium]
MMLPNPRYWTPSARRVVQRAREQAALRNEPAGTGDLLAALLFSGEGLGLMQQQRLGIPVRRLRRTWRLRKPGTQEPLDPDESGETSPFRTALRSTGNCAFRMSQSYRGCEHLLLSLLADPQCEATQWLRENGVECERCLENGVRELGFGVTPSELPDPEPRSSSPDPQPAWVRRMAELVRRYGLIPPPPADPMLPHGRPLTPRAGLAMDSAMLEVRRRQLGSLNTDLLLWGVLQLGNGCAIQALRRLGVDPESLCRALLGNPVCKVPDHGIADSPCVIPISAEVKEVLRQANLEAEMLSHTYLGTEHFVLGMLHETDHPAARSLSACGIELARFRNAVLDELDPGRTQETPPES